jgi:hypothetical protein
MTAPGATIPAHAAGDMSFGGDPVSGSEALDFNATFDDLTTKFVADREWHGNRFTRPVIPLIDMNVGAAYCSSPDPDQYIVVSDRRLVDILEPDAAFGLRFDQRSHDCGP